MSARLTSSWLNRASVIAMGAAFAATPPAIAQSFNASSTVAGGSANVATTVGITNVTVNTPQAVIDWTPTDTATGGGPIDFQSSGTTATFTNGASVTDFAVLNRILPVDPTRAVQFNGTVNGRVMIPPSGPTVTGGSVYFYSPGGIILGGSARFDVGALGLSTASPVFDAATGDFIVAGSVIYNAAVDGTAVVINSGAQITAPVDLSSYVAIFAPVIRQDGLIDVNGSTALVAAGAGTLTWSGGLFDIQVTVGSDGDASHTAIYHTGTTGGSTAGNGASGDRHRVFMVAVPKNSAITTLISAGGTMGFDLAGAADTDGNSVILTSGYSDVLTISGGLGLSPAGSGDIIVNNATATSDLEVFSTHNSALMATGGGATSVTSATLSGDSEARVEATGAGSSITANTLNISAAIASSASVITGGNALLYSNNGASVNVSGTVRLDASAFFQGSTGGIDATAGSARVAADGGGSINIGAALTINADGFGSPAGRGTGGFAEVTANGGGSITLASLSLSALGVGGTYDGSFIDGGDGVGGTAQINAALGPGSAITITGDTILDASGSGGNGDNANAGRGIGGRAEIFVGGSNSLVVNVPTGQLVARAEGIGGSAFGTGIGGAGTGGIAQISATGGTLSSNAFTGIYGGGFGGSSVDGAGGIGTGGRATLSVNAGGSIALSAPSEVLDIHAPGSGGSAQGAGDGGLALSGISEIIAQNGGAITVDGATTMVASALAGSGANGGNANGLGSASVSANGGTVTINGSLAALSEAMGGDAFASGGKGGDATAGEVDIIVDAGASGQRGAISIASYSGLANAFGGAGSVTGASYFAGGPILSVQHGSFSAGSVTMLTTGSTVSPAIPAPAGRLFLVDSTINVTGDFNIRTPGALSVFADSASLTAADVTLVAGDFVNDVGGHTPATPGTLGAGSISILSGNNIILGASLNSTGSALNLNANGLISVLDLTAVTDIFGTANGPITTRNLKAGKSVVMSTLSNLSVQAVNAGFVNLFAPQGLLSVNGVVSAPDISVTSNDIAIGATGGLNAGATGTIQIVGMNSAGMRIGDGVSGAGYQLDNSEFSRIFSGSLSLATSDVSALPIDMTIGDLDITGSGGTIGLPNGAVTFFTGNLSTQAASGTIRVVGSVRARGFGAGNELVFDNDTTEVDAQTGLLETVGTGTSLAGGIRFMSRRVHVAQRSILDRLQQDPYYAGRVVDINTPLATARPNGVIRTQAIGTDNAIAVLVQNTGTLFLPAGFLVFSDGPINQSSATRPGSLEFIINGRLMTPGGLLFGNAVHDFLVDDSNRAFFTAASTINGCLVSTVACGPPPSSQDFLESDNFTIFGRLPDLIQPDAAFGEPQSEEERKEQEEAAEVTKKAPIPPPTPLISTRPLDPPIDVDEPVSGSGNPALIGGGVQP